MVIIILEKYYYMKYNYTEKKSKNKAILFGVLIACTIIITGIFLINPVNSLVAASLNQNAKSTVEMNKPRDPIPQLNGSVNVFEKSHDFINNSINVSFAEAAKIAQDQFSNAQNITIVDGKLSVEKGSLVYSFTWIDQDTKTKYFTYVDPRNGSVLSKSEGMSISKPFSHGYFGDHDRFQRLFGIDEKGHQWNGLDLGPWFNKLAGSNGHNNTEGNQGWFSHNFHQRDLSE